ncbi:centromere protein X isoform X1 [Sparus aurata]|uniref:centromere protein X isoform X1 n=1 Tax=Sparus aurata TaxID=8175 RepID=UPI0011C16D06|nr:centromere protein X isoform X1 [Sparus aurata]
MQFGTRKPRRRTHASTGCKIRACYPYLQDTVSKLLASFFKEDKTRLGGDATLLMADMLKIFVQEAAVRSLKQAESEDCDQVDIEHFEKILPQLLLDF